MTNKDALLKILDDSNREVRFWLVACATYCTELAERGDETAGWLSGRVDAALDLMVAESIAVVTVLEEQGNTDDLLE